MKLRLRSIESKETLKMEAPNPCTLRQLKQIISQNLPNFPSPASIRLSLNRKDELRSDSPGGEDSLQLLGVAAGDLIFFTLDPGLVQNHLPVSEQEVGNDSKSVDIHPSLESEASQDLNAGDSPSEPKISEFDGLERKTLDTATQLEESTDCMELDYGFDENYNISGGFSADVVEESFSVPGYLRKVFMDELNDDCGRDHELTVVAIHAVFSESGFVGFDRNSNKQVGGFQFNDWPSGGFMPSVSYTLPDIVARGDGIDSIVLKFHSLGKFMSVYGSLRNESRGHGTHFLKLNEDQLVPLLNVVWANCGVTESLKGFGGGVSTTSPEKELFKFWRDVKDNLALPLLIGLCEKTGVELPPCFIRLPTDLKMEIMELLPGVDVAKISCVCSELRYIASSDDLWKLKFNEQFQNERTEGYASWKKAFAVAWEREKLGKVEERRIRAAPRSTRHLNPFFTPQVPRVIGGPHDIWPVLGDDTLARLRFPVNPRIQNFSPRCRLGGQNNVELI
ncbi:F-box protein SKIP22-like [Primulina huaijiensis]|uniref:F-box protein SKIP22-like n=1 Tax=Primulina huaijiensis TaxID=1492673 RepID=UPI003CC7337E